MRILAISKKVLLELLRDKRSLILLFLAPIFIMWLMNTAFSASTDTHVKIASVNVSDTITKSLDDVKHISSKDYKTEKAAKKALKDEKVDAILIYKDKENYKVTYANTDPSKTSLTRQAIKSTLKQTQVQELVQNLKKAQQASAQAAKKAQEAQAKAAQAQGNPAQSGINSGIQAQAASNTGDKQTKVNTKQTKFDLSENYIYGDKDTTFFTKMTPILMGFFVFFFVFLISGMALLKERTTGTLDRLLATPVKRSDIVFGYMLSYSFIAALQTTVIVLSTIWLLDLDVLGSMGDVIVVNILFALVALSFGLLLSTLAQSEFQMMQFIPIVIVPQIFFSGIIPLDSMADWVQSLGKILPLYYAGHALSKIILNGISIFELEPDLFALLIFLAILTALNVIGLKRYRKV
ncbi:putative integral membrane protein [Streptococcus mutans 3SN1]|uniref:ABC transporter permease n=1 Tax=Streptococcus mutans TaxID=1309 RepID=UPI0002B55F45|nr:ABC transporter permease [Streptococcus mutans]EMB64751.1 putative integral membrane protein [Streptococcus mutans 3SN1]